MENILDIVDNYIIIVDKCWNIQFCNKKLLTKLKYNLEELKNSGFEKITYTKNENSNIDIRKIKRQSSLKIDIDLHSKEGKIVSLYSEIIVDNFEGKESIFIVSKDICEKSYKREDLERILDNMPFNCWLKNMNGEYVFVNESYAKELKDHRLNILGKKTSQYWNKKDCDLFTDMDREVIDSKKYQLTQNYSKQGESDLWVEVYKAPIINKKNEVDHIIGFTRDITLQKELENKIFINNKELNNLNNILIKNNTRNNIYDLLNDIGEDILNYLECDGISILLLNKDESCLDLAVDCGVLSEYSDNKIIKVNLEKFKDISDVRYLNNINNIKDIKDDKLFKYMESNGIEHIGIYDISFNDETIGILLLKYLENNILRFNKFDYLKTICENIATMIKSHTVSEELQYEFEKRKQIENELEMLLDISVDLIAKTNINGEIEHVNNNWTKTLGWSEEELLSMSILDLVYEESEEEFKTIMKNREVDTGCIGNKLRCKDGSFRWIEFNYKILRDEDTLIITAKDISEQRNQEEQRKILEKAIQMESLKNEFFANISHEFRTPLNIILGTMQLMQRNVETNKINWDNSLNLESHINYIKQNSYRLLRLVNNLIDITCIDSGYYQLQLGNYNIVDIVENITLSVAEYIKEQGVNLIFDTNCEEKIMPCDPDKIERIMLNLLSNAIKYTEKNGFIYVELYVYDENIKVSVKDNGIGISKDKLDIIFDRFKKIDNNLNRKCEGSGIGLSLVKSLVELHDGEIYAKSKLGEGSEFIFELPIEYLDISENIILERDISKSSQIEKCNIEFSDIYS